ILVSHCMEDIAKTVQTVAVMNHGSMVMNGTVAEVFARGDELRGMGLNTPQISRIVDGLIKAGLPLDRNIFTVEDAADAIEKYLRKGNGKCFGI
ncbi:MAG: energy-coupling factor transporter ATPase, partial [Clostridia bacterium]